MFDVLLDPSIGEAERTSLLVALTARRPRAQEWAALAGEMRRRARPFDPARAERAVDLCGSGGAPKPSFNVSTVSAFVVAASGRPVIKHGNRSARGTGGSSDLLVALGLPVEGSTEFSEASFRKFGLAFLHAPLYHPAMAVMASARRRLGVPTIFNRLGPLSNPARVRFQVVGWGRRAESPLVAETLARLGVHRGLTMTSTEGCDEFSPRRLTYARSWKRLVSRSMEVDPTKALETEERIGAWGAMPPRSAAEETERLLAGGGGARRGSVLLTSGAALWVAGDASSLSDGVTRARSVLDEGAPKRLLDDLRTLARDYSVPGGG